MNNKSRNVLAVALSLSMIFNSANAKVKKEVYLPPEPIKIEGMKLLRKKNNKKNM